MIRRVVALAACAVASLAPPGARAAAPACASSPNVVVVAGSTAMKPLLAEVAKLLASRPGSAITIVYQGLGSCSGVGAILDGTKITGAAAVRWDPTGAETVCELPADGASVDLGVSDVFATTCFRLPGGLPSNVADFLGPVQTMTFVVPRASQERSISSEAAYNVFGFGSDSGVAPWTDESAIFRRDSASGTQRMIAAAIGVDATRWRGTQTSGSGDLLGKLTTTNAATKAIGILSSDVAQDERARLRVLAYQHRDQRCGYFPDRDETSNEKINVRDGHYAIWGPVHLLTRIGGDGAPLRREVGEVVSYLAGTKTNPALDLVALEARRHVVPTCAMRVRRSEELGPLQSYAPAGACGCYYEKVANGATSCTTCSSANDCPSSAPICSYGYCETQ